RAMRPSSAENTICARYRPAPRNIRRPPPGASPRSGAPAGLAMQNTDVNRGPQVVARTGAALAHSRTWKIKMTSSGVALVAKDEPEDKERRGSAAEMPV